MNGRFYLQQTSNGNLIGEFSNDQSTGISTESCDFLGCSDIAFLGKYHSTWQENKKLHFADLEITHKPNTNKKIFTLKWRGVTNFDGEGMLCNDVMIGNYYSV